MKQLFLALLVPAIFFVSQLNCLASPDVSGSFDRASAVFIGEVTEIKKPISSDPSAPLTDQLHKVSFKVEYSWKGAGFQEFGTLSLVVLSDQGINDDCLRNCYCFSWGSFREGSKYLVFAEETAEKDLVVWSYSQTSPLVKASEDLKELQKMSSPFYRFRVKP